MPPHTLRARGQGAYALMLAAALAGFCGLLVSATSNAIWNPPAKEALVADGGPRPLTEGQSMDGFGAWSPDGREIAFMRDGKIWLMAASGSQSRAVSGMEGTWDASPAWRPDGKEIAFVRHFVSVEKSEVVAMDPSTQASRSLTAVGHPIGHIAWAPDGKWLYFTTPQQLIRLELASGKTDQVLALQQGWEISPGGLAVTPDGSRVVFGAGPRVERGVLYELFMVRLDGKGEAERLTRGGGIMPAFDRQGRRLAYRNPRGATGIYEIDMTASRKEMAKPRLILRDDPRALYFHPAFAPDGSTLLLSRLRLDGNPRGDGAGQFTSALCLHRLRGSGGD